MGCAACPACYQLVFEPQTDSDEGVRFHQTVVVFPFREIEREWLQYGVKWMTVKPGKIADLLRVRNEGCDLGHIGGRNKPVMDLGVNSTFQACAEEPYHVVSP